MKYQTFVEKVAHLVSPFLFNLFDAVIIRLFYSFLFWACEYFSEIANTIIPCLLWLHFENPLFIYLSVSGVGCLKILYFTLNVNPFVYWTFGWYAVSFWHISLCNIAVLAECHADLFELLLLLSYEASSFSDFCPNESASVVCIWHS